MQASFKPCSSLPFWLTFSMLQISLKNAVIVWSLLACSRISSLRLHHLSTVRQPILLEARGYWSPLITNAHHWRGGKHKTCPTWGKPNQRNRQKSKESERERTIVKQSKDDDVVNHWWPIQTCKARERDREDRVEDQPVGVTQTQIDVLEMRNWEGGEDWEGSRTKSFWIWLTSSWLHTRHRS